jgi:hypothetical protein
MGTIEVRKGRWGALTDLIYVDFGSSKSMTRDFSLGNTPIPADVNADLQLDVKGWIWTLGGTYRLGTSPGHDSALVFGARYLDIEQTLNWNFNGDIGSLPLPGRSGASQGALNNWDGIVGVKGRVDFGESRRWYMPYYADIGTGESKLTWQALVGLGYRFDWGAVVGAWRYLDYEFKSSSALQSLNFNGPALGVTFHW